MPPPVFRFAPSPNGYLHLGHALSALLNADQARAAGGRLLLRIEDIDTTRCRPEFETAIYEDLAWLGLEWEQPVRRQSEHFDAYRDALAKLDAMGLIYPSFESRSEIAALVAARGADWPRDPDGAPLYPGIAKTLSPAERTRLIASGAPYALRLDMTAAVKRISSFTSPLVGEVARLSESEGEREGGELRSPHAQLTPSLTLPLKGGRELEFAASPFPLSWLEKGAHQPADPSAWGDIVLARKDAPASYHLAVTVDDAIQGITDVVRGHDLFPSTGVHRLLQSLLGWPSPRYHHHRLILDADGRKLSKSTRATALRELRAKGESPASIRKAVGLD